MRIVATVNALEEGNSAWQRFADRESYRPMFGEEAGDGGAGRRLVYSVGVGGADGATILDAFRNSYNALEAEEDLRAFRIPEPLPPRMPEVEAAGEEIAVQVPELPVKRYAGLDGLALNGAGAVHENGVEAAVLDTGFDDVWAQRCFSGEPGMPTVVAHQQFTDEDHPAILPGGVGHFHGTHCAGLLAAGTRIRLNIGQVLGDDGSGMTSWIVAGIYWAVRMGCRVVSLSLGGGAYSQALADAVLYARRRGCLVICAMGNDGQYLQMYPAAYPGATGVIASHYRDYLRASFSNYGEWAHGTTDGVSVLSWGLDGALVRASGTSMATPLYAGAAARLIAEHGGPSVVLKVLAATSRGTPEPVLEEGHGALDARAADAELRRKKAA